MRRPDFVLLFACAVFVFINGINAKAQSLLQSTQDGTDLFDRFQDAQFEEKSDKEVMQEEFRKKRAAYESLMSKESPILFQADYQEIDDNSRVFTLSGNVEIQKEVFRLKADWVRIHQWSGEVEAKGNVVLEFDKDVLTGDEAAYNFNTGTGWISNARAAVEPQLYLETELLEKLPDFDGTGMGQYALHQGSISACSGKIPAWKFYTKYAVIRLENYAHMNGVSAWIKNIPIFWSPYFFYPTKTDRATGLLTPRVNWSSTRGFIASQEFFLCINDYLDMTAGLTAYSIVGIQEEFQFRNAFDALSKGELNVEHIKERVSPSKNRDPEERWRMTYEQNAMFPMDIRGTANLIYQSDESYGGDYGGYEEGINQFLDSRLSLTRYWGTAGLTLDGSYQKQFSIYQDERLQYMPRLEFFSGRRYIWDDFTWQLRLKGERLFKAGNALATIDDSGEAKTEWQRLEKESFRYFAYGSVGYEYSDIPWLNIYPWMSIEDRLWSEKKSFDPQFQDGSWATYDELPEATENSWRGGLYENGDGLFRHLMKTGIDLTGPKLYRIFDVLGYKTLSRTKHVIEPKITLEHTPEIKGQEKVMYFDTDDFATPGTKLTYSLTTRLLMKLKTNATKKSAAKTGVSGASVKDDEERDDIEGGDDIEDGDDIGSAGKLGGSYGIEDPGDGGNAMDLAGSGDEATSEREGSELDRDGVIREFGYLTVSQTYDFYKESHWDEREVEPGQDERIFYPFSNINMNVTINPVANIYLSGRVEFDPWHNDFSNGYLYGHVKQKEWEFGLRWDYSRNFTDNFFDVHAIALEGGMALNDAWRFGSWVKYDFSGDFIPYFYFDLTYMAECWGVTLHTFYKNNREFNLFDMTYEDDPEIKFGLSFHLKNIETIDTNSFGKFWWGDYR